MENIKMNSLIALLNTENTLSVNRLLAHSIGLEETIMYQALIKKYIYYRDRGALVNNQYFYSTAIDLEESTTFSGKKQKKLADRLTELGLIKKKKMGMPSKNYYCIILDSERLIKFIEDGEEKAIRLKEKRYKKMEDDRKTRTLNKEINNDLFKNNKKETPTNQGKIADAPNGNSKLCQTGTASCAELEQQAVPNGNSKLRQTETTCYDEQGEHAAPNGNTKLKDNKLKEKTKENKLNYSQSNQSSNDNLSISTNENANNIINDDDYDKRQECYTGIRNQGIGDIERKYRKAEKRAEELIDYQLFKKTMPEQLPIINIILSILIELFTCTEEEIKFGNTTYSVSEFEEIVSKLDYETLCVLINNIYINASNISNPRSYIAKVLYQSKNQVKLNFVFDKAQEKRDEYSFDLDELEKIV